jgi:hypothetical protein
MKVFKTGSHEVCFILAAIFHIDLTFRGKGKVVPVLS